MTEGLFASAGLVGGFFITLAIILLLVGAAVAITINSSRLARWLVRMNRVVSGPDAISKQRRQTLVRLYASLISFLAILMVIIGVMRLFVDPAQIIWIIGLFSAAFGLGARVLVSDLLAGATFIFRNTFTIGEKTEFTVGGAQVEGTVEDVNMRSTLLRAPTGELYTVPNGEITIIRNFTRASYSGAMIKIKVLTAQLILALRALQELGQKAEADIPEQIGPWQILITEEAIGPTTVLSVNARFTFGNAAALKPHVAALMYDGLTAAGVQVME